jgi:hypothetical protein
MTTDRFSFDEEADQKKEAKKNNVLVAEGERCPPFEVLAKACGWTIVAEGESK